MSCRRRDSSLTISSLVAAVFALLNDELGLGREGARRVLLQNPAVFSLAIDTLRDKFRYLESR